MRNPNVFSHTRIIFRARRNHEGNLIKVSVDPFAPRALLHKCRGVFRRARRNTLLTSIMLLKVAAATVVSFGCWSPSLTTLPPSAAPESAMLARLDQSKDEALALVRKLDAEARASSGELPRLTAAEHARRATLYSRNRLFNEAREHWQALVARYPADAEIPAALFGIGRAFYQERRFAEALPYFERLGKDHSATPDGREGFYYVAPTLLRLDKAVEATRRYELYIKTFPAGERIESAHLNLIDTLREANLPAEAVQWVARTRARFPNTVTDQNALFARLRAEIAQNKWDAAATTADELRRSPLRPGVGTNATELAFLRAYSLEQAKRIAEAVTAYAAIPDAPGSYYGGRATARLARLGVAGKRLADARTAQTRLAARRSVADYPAAFRTETVGAARSRGVDPRFVLAVMRQESGFRPAVKSSAAARGLMQLTVDTASKYAPRVGLGAGVTEAQLYVPNVSILVASEYLAELNRLFPNLPEAVAASYNGGEDNAARWVRRAGQAASDEPGVFAAEVGFTETKDYVFKVLANYRAYRELYTNDLQPLVR